MNIYLQYKRTAKVNNNCFYKKTFNLNPVFIVLCKTSNDESINNSIGEKNSIYNKNLKTDKNIWRN